MIRYSIEYLSSKLLDSGSTVQLAVAGTGNGHFHLDSNYPYAFHPTAIACVEFLVAFMSLPYSLFVCCSTRYLKNRCSYKINKLDRHRNIVPRVLKTHLFWVQKVKRSQAKKNKQCRRVLWRCRKWWLFQFCEHSYKAVLQRFNSVYCTVNTLKIAHISTRCTIYVFQIV